MAKSDFVDVNGIRLHYLDYPVDGPTVVLLHGLSANAQCFSLLAQGLSPYFRVIVPDLRGRGLSDKPATGYTMNDHALDILGLMDTLGVPQVILAGHSFGGLLAIYM